jgi:hypothetical protein
MCAASHRARALLPVSHSSGECPPEIDPGPTSEPVTVNLIRVEEDYVPPK